MKGGLLPNAIKMPHFHFNFAKHSTTYFGVIEADDNVIHHIKNIDKFYGEFGYTTDMAKAGVLPDEFVWAEYIKDDNAEIFATCLQVHIIEYLTKCSDTFRKQYGTQSKHFIASHALEKETNTYTCAACRLKFFCEP
jgi:hypothetical protein